MKTRNIFPIVLCATLVIAGFACTAGTGISNLFSTPTPTVTATFTSSPTLIPTITPTITPTTTPSPTGLTTEELVDGSTLVVDYDNNFQFVLPDGWIVLPLSSEDFVSILGDMAEENPELADIAKGFEYLESDAIRVIALNENPKYIADEFGTNISVVAFEDKVLSAMPMEFITGAIEESIAGDDVTLLSTGVNVKENPNGIEIGMIDSLQTAPTASGKRIEVRSRVVLFKTDDKLLMITMAVQKQFGDELLPVLDQVVDSINTLNP